MNREGQRGRYLECRGHYFESLWRISRPTNQMGSLECQYFASTNKMHSLRPQFFSGLTLKLPLSDYDVLFSLKFNEITFNWLYNRITDTDRSFELFIRSNYQEKVSYQFLEEQFLDAEKNN